MSKIFEFMKPYSAIMIFIALLLTIEAILGLIMPGYMADIINDGVLPGNTALIWRAGIVMLLITLASMATALISGYFAAKVATGIANDLRESLFRKVLGFSNAEVNHFTTSSLITRTTNDITQVQNTLMMAIRQFIYAPVIGIGGIILALDRSPSLTWVIALAVVAMTGLMVALFFTLLPKFGMVQKLIDRLNLVSRENLSGILIVRAFNTQKFEVERFNKANKDLAQTNLFVGQAFAFLFPVITLILNLTTVLIVWVGAHEVSAFRIDIGDIFAFLQYGLLVIFAFLMVAIMFVLLPRAVVSAGRIKEVLETDNSIKYKKHPTSLPKNFKGVVEFRNVSFRYPDAKKDDDEVLRNISFIAKPGETTAIIGATGSGKTTIFKLLLRFFDVDSGGIYVDGINIKDIDKKSLHDKIGYITQKAILFSGDIYSNLLYANKSASKKTIEDAVSISQSKAFIESKPEKYNANVAQGGSNFSGGQKQRLSIARALVKNAPIYLFDDSFSALDLKTDSLLRSALKKKVNNSTILIVAQRISTIMNAQQIIVLDHGEIVGIGTHKQLLKTCKVYKEIAVSQLSPEELKT
ncbi:MAG: ABC transporter ATP-binding protein/permease [Pseudomonadales bacterium]|nr:ABC transporter ATP-binding protein/permease [Pseudomonadales bacterium]